MVDLLPYIVGKIERLKLKHEVHSFDSGAIMVDFWVGQCFYVVQIDNDTIGISLVTEETTPFDVIPDYSFKNSKDFKTAFEKVFHDQFDKKVIIIKGDSFSSFEGFYDEVDTVLTKNLNWKTGHNLDAFNDLLRGGFGVHEYEEPITLIWENSHKSKAELNMIRNERTIYEILVDIIKSHAHIDFIER
ncbi:barstar family protein [Flavihumibacter sp. CACIAM 22H1]|uniref:barstar family protein n=1 Tax=Flavihumibacter sp. CACIAM 22H1 TaxID=1812911 RepID=UPI000B11B4F2|nr:barstar family protein [Flavihumibacter sp. CACIAM 22H1]